MKQQRLESTYFMKVMLSRERRVSTAARMSAWRASEWFLLSDSRLQTNLDLNVLYVSILDKCAALNAPTQCSATTAMLLSCRSWPWSDTDLGSWALTCLWQRLWYRSTFRKPWLRTRWHIKSIRLHTWVATQESNSSLSNIYGLMKILALNLANNNTTTKMEKAYHTVKTEHDKIIIQSRVVRWRYVGMQWLQGVLCLSLPFLIDS